RRCTGNTSIKQRSIRLQYSPSHIARFSLIGALLILCFNINSLSQPSRNQKRPTPRKIGFAEAQKLLANENEGNLSKQPGKFSRTKLSGGQVLELYYPITAPDPRRRSRTATVPGYGMLYESELAYKEANRVPHVLEDLIPDAHKMVSDIPQLVARLEKRLRLGAGKLDYSRASLKRIDAYLAGYLRSRSTMQTDPQMFQELTAYYGETLRRAVGGEWQIRKDVVSKCTEPNIILSGGGVKEIKPWSGLVTILYDYTEENRGAGLTRLFDADLAAASR
ncbi:MAG: hypothetical protein ACREA2_02420, partial [Blastocatellia bacterium]